MPSELGSPSPDTPDRSPPATAETKPEADATRLIEALIQSYDKDPPNVRFTPDEPIGPDKATEPTEPPESDRMFRLDRTEEATIVEHPGRPDGQTVFAGHGYRTGEEGWFVVPNGTTIAFHCNDGESLGDSEGMKVEMGDASLEPIEVVSSGTRMPDWRLAHPHGLTVSSSSRLVEQDTKLSELLEPEMGTVHWAACRVRLTGTP